MSEDQGVAVYSSLVVTKKVQRTASTLQATARDVVNQYTMILEFTALLEVEQRVCVHAYV